MSIYGHLKYNQQCIMLWIAVLPTILTMANDGSYSRAMVSMEDMESFVEHLNYQFDQAANMDW